MDWNHLERSRNQMKDKRHNSETYTQAVRSVTVDQEQLATFQTWRWLRQTIIIGSMPGKFQETDTHLTKVLLSPQPYFLGLILSLLRQFTCHFSCFFFSFCIHTRDTRRQQLAVCDRKYKWPFWKCARQDLLYVFIVTAAICRSSVLRREFLGKRLSHCELFFTPF